MSVIIRVEVKYTHAKRKGSERKTGDRRGSG